MGRYRFFGDVVSLESWQTIQEQCADAFGMEVHTLGPGGEDLCPPSRLSRYRALLNSTPQGREQIPDGRLDVVRRTGRHGEVLVEETSTGRLRFSVPLFFRGEYLATITGGGHLARPMSASHVEDLAARAAVNAEELRRAVAELRVGDKQTYHASGQVIASLLVQVVAAVEHRHEAELQARRVQVLAHVGQVVTDSLDLPRVMEVVVDAIGQVMEVKACLVGLVDDDGVLRNRASRGLGRDFLALELTAGEGLAGAVLASGRPLNIADMPSDPRSVRPDLDRREGLHAMLAVPLRDGDVVLGVISVFRGNEERFDADDQQVLLNFADYTAAAVRNAQLYGRMRQAYRELGVATRRLQDVQEQLFHSARLAEVGRLAGGAAHEMKNTLGGIIGAAATVRDQLADMKPEDVRELVAAIAEEGWRLRDTIESVRSYAKPKHYGVGRHPLLTVVEETVRLLQFDSKYAGLTIDCRVGANLEFVGDRDRFKQVLLNLLRNAADAVRGLEDREPRVEVEAETDDAGVLVRVIDNGVGIPPEQLERIWEPFYTTKGQAGTGLGLDLVRQMIQAQGGEIGVASTVGQGTVFTIRLPGGSAAEAAQAADSESETKPS
jgi:signal transduction histidine kinase